MSGKCYIHVKKGTGRAPGHSPCTDLMEAAGSELRTHAPTHHGHAAGRGRCFQHCKCHRMSPISSLEVGHSETFTAIAPPNETGPPVGRSCRKAKRANSLISISSMISLRF